MKKVLFATTALIATASVAAADVRISGYGRFGLDYNEANKGTVVSTTNITSRLRLQFDMTTEADSGVEFFARFRAQAENRNNFGAGTSSTTGNANGAVRNGKAEFNGARFGVRYEGFTVIVGNIIGAVDNLPGLYLPTRSVGIGVDGSGFTSLVTNSNGTAFTWDSYSSGGGGVNGIEALYSAGGFTGHVSFSRSNKANVNASAQTRTGVMLAYNFGDWTVAAAHQNVSNPAAGQGDKLTAIAVSGDLGQFGVGLSYADNDGAKKFRLNGDVEIGAASKLVAFVSREQDYTGTAGVGQMADANSHGTNFGIDYSYDLGGGATFVAGAVRHMRPNQVKNTRVQAGVYFSF